MHLSSYNKKKMDAFASDRARLKEWARRHRKRKVYENESFSNFVQSVEQLRNRGPIFGDGK